MSKIALRSGRVDELGRPAVLAVTPGPHTPSMFNDPVLTDRVADRLGIVTRTELLADGWSSATIERRVRSGALAVVFAGVYRATVVSPNPDQQIVAAVLASGPGTAAAGRSAARLLRLDGLSGDWTQPGPPRPIDVISGPGHRIRRPGITAHRTSDPFDRGDFAIRFGVRTLSATRVLLDAPRWAKPQAVSMALDDALRRGLTALPVLQARHESLPRARRPGDDLIDRLLADRRAGNRETTNALEAFARSLLFKGGLPRPQAQFRVDLPGGGSRFIDLAYPDVLLGIDTDGYEHHAEWSDWSSDQVRSNELGALGWLILRATWDIRRRPDQFVDWVRRARAVRLDQLRLAPRTGAGA